MGEDDESDFEREKARYKSKRMWLLRKFQSEEEAVLASEMAEHDRVMEKTEDKTFCEEVCLSDVIESGLCFLVCGRFFEAKQMLTYGVRFYKEDLRLYKLVRARCPAVRRFKLQ